MSVYRVAVAVDSGEISVCATLMETHQKAMLNICDGKQTGGLPLGGSGICGDSEKVQTRDGMLNGANSAQPLTANSKVKFCIHMYRRRLLLGRLLIM
jgi:hypothetical protein